jgi:hypothetical protein
LELLRDKYLGTDLALLGENTLVPFQAYKLNSGRILWINERYWMSKGIDIINPSIRKELEKWLLDEYGYVVLNDDTTHFVSSDQKTFFADRYGGSGGATHGGSGRCGISGQLNIKGIGATPLVARPEVTDWAHSHGCAWITEAIREAVAAEIAYQEFPHRAIPVVAIIDSGILTSHAENNYDARRALIIRPNFVRLAHLQRSIYFGSAGHKNSDQYKDALRTEKAVQVVWGNDKNAKTIGVKCKTLRETMIKIADQLAFSYAHRLGLGGINSSNITVDGEIVDFGLFSSLPNWSKIYTNPSLPPFGQEWQSVLNIIKSLLFFQKKYLSRAENFSDICDAFSQRVFTQFGNYIKSSLSVSINNNSTNYFNILISSFRLYYATQQKKSYALTKSGNAGWLYEALAQSRSRDSVSDEIFYLTKTIESLHKNKKTNGKDKAAWASLCLYLFPRPHLNWDASMRRVSRLVREHVDSEHFPTKVDIFINSMISKSRRFWKNLPPNLIITKNHTNTYRSLLLCADVSTGKKFYMLSMVENISNDTFSAVKFNHNGFSSQLSSKDIPKHLSLNDGEALHGYDYVI